jgi:LysM repeat protein
MRYYLCIFVVLSLFSAGCASDPGSADQGGQIKQGDFILSTKDAAAGSVYELRVYVVAAGDTITKIALKFQISHRELMALNPGLPYTRLYVGQAIRVYEHKQK